MKGAEEIQQMMADFRANPPATLAGQQVVRSIDYQASISKDLLTGNETTIDLPKSNVLQFLLQDGSKVSARPSGTEPKIKFYISVNAPLANSEAYQQVKESLKAKIEHIKADLKL